MALLSDILDMEADALKSRLEKGGKDTTDPLIIVDVRTPKEYRQGHIPGAKHVPLGHIQDSLDRDVSLFEPDLPHVFYCRSGMRSQRAALLARAGGMVRGPIHNLKGGIAAWDGMALPDIPRVDILAGVTDTAAVLLRAMDMEKAAHLFYADIARRIQDPETRDMAEKLTDMELGHTRVVYSRFRALKGKDTAPPFEELFEPMEGEVIEGGRSMAELEPWIDAALAGDGLDLMELALEIEYNAHDLYQTLAHDSKDDPESQEIFLDLSRQELNHVRVILKRMDALA